MRKLFLTLILLYSTFLYAEIDERKSDVYFANGVDTDIGEANKAKNELDKQTKKLYPEAYKQIKDWKVSYNETHGFQQDIYESAIQKLFTKLDDTHSGYGYAGATAWVVDTVMQTPGLKDFVKGALYFGGRKLVKDTLKELLIEETKNTLAKRGLILSKEDILFLADLIFDELLDNLLANPLDDTLDDINKDVLTQATAYANSIEQGHGVIVVAHSQGNFFTNFTVEEKMQPWTQKYFHVLGVATPTSSIANGGAYLTFDNDVIQAVPGHLGWNVKNPKRYQFSNTNIETFFSVEAHNFLESYMATPATSNAILGFIEGAITTHNTADSQWKKSKKFGCRCKERIYVEHKYDTSLNQLMNEVDVVAFEEILKLYPIKGEYYKGSYNGDDIKKYETGEVCIDLLNNNGFAIDEFLGKVEETNPKSGVVEISLTWDNEDVDLDLQVGWSAGSVDVKDICDPFEHFHIRSEATIYPGTYGVSIMPKDSSAEIFDDPSIYPLTVELVTRTPGASDSMRFTIKSKSKINLGHVSNIKVYRVNEDETDKEEEDGSDGTGGLPSFFIAPSVAPNCPPVNHTPSPTPPRAIVFSSGSSGGYSFSGGGGGGWAGGGGGSSGTLSSSGYSVQLDPRCSGDIECIGAAMDFYNNHAVSPTGMQAPSSPKVGGEPIRNIVQEDACKGNFSCKCIPCEYEIIPILKQVNFGPIRGANFSIYTLDGYRLESSIYDGITSNGNTLYDAGEIDIPKGILETLDDETLYVIKTQGGEDIDRDDNFVIDGTPTQNLGKAYALIKGKDIKTTGFKINILTTVTFTLLEKMILEGAATQQIEEEIDAIASRLLRYKIYPETSTLHISNLDLLSWLPAIDKDILLQPYEPLEAMVSKMYTGDSIYEEAYNYVYFKSSADTNSSQTIIDEQKPPIIKTFVTSIPEDTQGGSTLGTIEILRGSEDITFASLSGKGSELFTISTSGEIKLKEDAQLDYETKWLYKLKAKASNKNGSSGEVAVYISIEDVIDAPIFVSYEAQKLKEDAKPGDIVGKITFDRGAAPITAIELQGKSTELFHIALDGTITVAQGASFDYESKYAYGFVVIAKNNYGNSMPALVYINIDDVADSPKITDYKGGYIHEDAPSGSVVGEVVFDKGGAEIDSISLEGAGSQNFTIDADGVVQVAQNATLDYESYNFYILTVHISNTYGTANQNIFVSLVDTLDVPSFVSFNGGNVKENSPVNTVVGQIVFDSGSVPIESISLTGDPSGAFKILDNGTILVAKNILDYEQKNHYVLQVTATNAFGSSQVVEVHIFVDDIPERAVVLEDFVVNEIVENVAAETVLGNIEILDNGSGAIYEYEIIGDKKEYFHVDAQGVVRTAKTLDYETDSEYNLKVKARNEAGWSYGANLIVRLKDVVDEKPSFSASSIYFDVFENDDNVGKIVFHAGDSSVTSLTLSGTGSEKFSLDLNGDLRVKAGELLDYDRGERYFGLNVTATNTAGSSSIPIEVNVLNVHDIPEIYDVNLSTVFANIPVDSIIGQIHFHTGDSPLTHVELNGDDAHYFDVDTNGTIRIKTPLESFELKKTYDFTVAFVNSSGESLPKDIKIWLSGVPVLMPTTLNVVIQSPTNTKIGTVQVKDQGLAPITDFTLTGDDSEKFAIDATGAVYVLDSNLSLSRYYRFRVSAKNMYGEGQTQELTITVFPLEPVLQNLTLTVQEKTETGSVVGKVTVLSSPSEILNMTLSGDGHEKFGIDKNGVISLNGSLSTLEKRAYFLLVTASNHVGKSRVSYVTIHISDSENTLKLEGFNTTIYEDIAINSTLGILNVSGLNDDTIDQYIIEGEGKENFFLDSNGVLSVASGAEFNDKIKSNYTLRIKAITQSSNTSTTAYVSITIYDAKEGHPLINPLSITVDENTPIGTVIGKIDVLTEGASKIQRYILQDWKTYQYFSVNASGEIVVKKHLDYETIQSFESQIQAENLNTQSNSVLLNVTINNLPDTPPILGHASLTITENTPGQSIIGAIPIRYTDDMPIDSFVISGAGKENFTILNDGTIQVADGADLDYEKQNYYTLGVQASNKVGTGAQVWLQIYLTDIGYTVDLLDTNIPINLYQEVGTQVGTLQINYNKEAPIEQIELLGEYAFIFEADATGAIFLKEKYEAGMPLSFILSVNISNRYGASDTRNVTIDFFSKEPYILGFQANVDENSVGGTLVGSVPIITQGEAPISSWKLSGNGSEKFTIENDGTIRVAQGANLDYEVRSKYELNVQAFNEFGTSHKQTVLITITDHIDPPTLAHSTLKVNEHSQGIFLGKVPFTPANNCNISSFVWQNQWFSSYIDINDQGEVYTTLNASFDYESSKSIPYMVYANTECGQTNSIELRIDVLDLDENGIVQLDSESKLSSAYISIQKIEADGTRSEVFRHYAPQQIFNTHKFELEPDSFYMYEILDGRIYKNNAYERDFQGKMRTIVKGSWMTEIERLRITPVSEAIVARLLEQKPILDPKTLEDDLKNLAKEYVHEDIDYNGEMNILDIIALDIFTTNAQYAIALDTSFIVRGNILPPMNLDSLNIISINNSSLKARELSGEGSEHFEVNEHNELIIKSPHNKMDQDNYIFDIIITDDAEHKSIAKVSVTLEPSIYLYSSYESNAYVYKIAASKNKEILFAAAGEDGVMVFTTQYQNLNPLTFYNTQTNAHIFTPNSKIVALTTYLYGEQEILFALNQTTSSLEIIDVTFPEIPVRLSTLALRDFSDIEADLIISKDGEYAYVAGSFVEKIDIQNLASPLSTSALNLKEKMPWNLQYYLHEEKSGLLTVKTSNEGYQTYFINTEEELFFILDNASDITDYPKVEYTFYSKYVQKGTLGYAFVWETLTVLDLSKKDIYGKYVVVNDSAWSDRMFGSFNDLIFSKNQECLYIVDRSGKIGILGFTSQEH